jgi:ribonucleotide reductase beta subunit family protein with ferritin-like domain
MWDTHDIHRMDQTDEPMLNDPPGRLAIFPIVHHDVWDMYQKSLASFWTVSEVDLSKDYDDWKRLSDSERTFLKNILAFFSSSDTIVNINLSKMFINDINILEGKFFYAFQMAIENIHSEMYSLLIDKYIKNETEKNTLFNAIENIPCIRKKADWCFRYIDESMTFAQRLIAFAIVEGVFFSGAFASIFWQKEQGKLPGLAFSNELISRDEALHVEFAVLMYSKVQNRVPEETVRSMFIDAVAIEQEFILHSIPCSMLGMNATLMGEYIEYVADRLLVQLGYNKVWNSRNPFPFMDRISIQNKTNFFESRVSEYSKANVGQKNIHEFALDADF